MIPIGGEVRQFQVQPDTVRMAELGISRPTGKALLGLFVQYLGRLPGG